LTRFRRIQSDKPLSAIENKYTPYFPTSQFGVLQTTRLVTIELTGNELN
jgi:hypothetical protein